MDKNRELHELLGHCWHEPEWIRGEGGRCKKCKIKPLVYELPANPDYAADPRLVLEEMMKREDWPAFCNTVGHSWATPKNGAAAHDYVYLFYILDTTGRLRNVAIKWLQEDGKNE